MLILHRLRNAALIAAASISLYALSGCAYQRQEANPPPESGTALQPTEPPIPAPQAEPAPAPTQPSESTATATAPEDFPLPLYTGLQVKGSLRTQTGDFKGIQVELVGDAAPQVQQALQHRARKTKRAWCSHGAKNNNNIWRQLCRLTLTATPA